MKKLIILICLLIFMSTMTITYAQDVSKIETSNHVAVVEQNQPIDTPTTSKPIASLVDAESDSIENNDISTNNYALVEQKNVVNTINPILQLLLIAIPITFIGCLVQEEKA